MIAPTMRRMTIQKDVGQVKCWMQEEQGETAGGVSNDEETDQDNLKVHSCINIVTNIFVYYSSVNFVLILKHHFD